MRGEDTTPMSAYQKNRHKIHNHTILIIYLIKKESYAEAT